ncbi:uncharacterized [Tachysurus ichikawai]
MCTSSQLRNYRNYSTKLTEAKDLRQAVAHGSPFGRLPSRAVLTQIFDGEEGVGAGQKDMQVFRMENSWI